MTHDPGNPRTDYRSTGKTTPADPNRPLPPPREAERWNLTLMIGIIVAVLVLLPLVIWGMWGGDDGPGTVLTPDAQVGTEPVADPAASPVVDQTPAPEEDAADGVVTDVAPADDATEGAVTDGD